MPEDDILRRETDKKMVEFLGTVPVLETKVDALQESQARNQMEIKEMLQAQTQAFTSSFSNFREKEFEPVVKEVKSLSDFKKKLLVWASVAAVASAGGTLSLKGLLSLLTGF